MTKWNSLKARHPGSAEIALIVEVTDTTGCRDRVTKKRIYANEGIPVYWVLDLGTGSLEIHSNPSGGSYQHVEMIASNGLAPVCIAGAEVGTVPLAVLLV